MSKLRYEECGREAEEPAIGWRSYRVDHPEVDEVQYFATASPVPRTWGRTERLLQDCPAGTGDTSCREPPSGLVGERSEPWAETNRPRIAWSRIPAYRRRDPSSRSSATPRSRRPNDR